METRLPGPLRDSPPGREAEAILRRCVHCGFCLATCPTYRETGDELDSPRGRIYLIKRYLETGRAGEETRRHLDRCLACRACETTCPSGVAYHRLLEIGRSRLRARLPAPPGERLLRWLLLRLVPRRRPFAAAVALGRLLRPLLPAPLARHVPRRRPGRRPRTARRPRHLVLFQGCVEPSVMGAARSAVHGLLDRLGYEARALAGETCCGALEHHLDAPARARRRARRNLALWRRALDGGAEAVVFLSSACLLEAREYPDLLAGDPDALETARQVLPAVRGLDEWLLARAAALPAATRPRRVAWHPPCTLQHGLKGAEAVPELLRRAGHTVLLPADAQLCCGAAGAYSLFQPGLSGRLRRRKLSALAALEPECIASANVGCLLHLAAATDLPVLHWAELL